MLRGDNNSYLGYVIQTAAANNDIVYLDGRLGCY